MDERKPLDVDAYVRSIATGPCFICELVQGNPSFAHHVIFEDGDTIIS